MKDSYQTWQEFLLDDDFVAWVKHPTPASDRRWQAWQDTHPDRRSLLEEAREMILAAQKPADNLSEAEVREMWQELQLRHQRKARSRTSRWLRVAASLVGVLLLGAGLVWWLTTPAAVTHRTAYGETQDIVLPDRSTVKLNANSTLSYTDDWEESKERTVALSGEAYFSVQPAANRRKFLVQTNTVVVEVVGTSFNVNQRHGRARVVLDEGEVTLHRPNEERIPMQAGDLVEISDTNYVKKQVSSLPYTAWTNNELVFEGTPLSEIAQLLEDNYGYRVTISNSRLANKQFRGRAPAGEVENLLQQLEKVFQLTITTQGKTIEIKSAK